MFRKGSLDRIFAPVLVGMFIWMIGFASPGFAQDDPLPEDSSCFECHQFQYFNYDSGKSFCFCRTGLCCTECHGGNPNTAVEELAHEGLIDNPLENEAALCQKCHPQDYQDRVEKFAAIAGIHPTPRPCPTCTPGPIDTQADEGGGGARLFRSLPPGSWQTIGAGFLGIAFLALFLFTCRCWKTDHLSQR